jgi:hypothetical protein
VANKKEKLDSEGISRDKKGRVIFIIRQINSLCLHFSLIKIKLNHLLLGLFKGIGHTF